MRVVGNTYKRLLLQLKRYTREHGKRLTSERQNILRYCCDLKMPITVADLIQAAKDEEAHICTQAVYDAVDYLVEAGILQRLMMTSQHVATYALVSERRNRLRLICTECGRVTSFKPLTLTEYFKARAFDNFDMKNYTVYVYGKCKSCRPIKEK